MTKRTRVFLLFLGVCFFLGYHVAFDGNHIVLAKVLLAATAISEMGAIGLLRV
jgi:hypothetical protein